MDKNTIEFIKEVIKASSHSPKVVDLSVDFIIENHGDHGIPVKVAGKRYYNPAKEYDVMTHIIRSELINKKWSPGTKIAMIKVFRELTKCGLLEAKNAVEDIDNWH